MNKHTLRNSLNNNNKPLIEKLSALTEKLIIYTDLPNNSLGFNLSIGQQLEIVYDLKEIISEINASNFLPDYWLQLKIRRRHGWNGGGIALPILKQI